MKLLSALLVFSMAFSLTQSALTQASLTASKQCGCGSGCPPCNPKAGCRIWKCPCTHDGFIMHPGNEPLNPPRPSWCPKCVSECDNYAIKCVNPYYQCDAEQVATYKCIEPIPDDYIKATIVKAEVANA